jgi:hypothetical protein
VEKRNSRKGKITRGNVTKNEFKENLCYGFVSSLSCPQQNGAHRTKNGLTAFVSFVFYLPLEEAYVY